MYPEDYVYSKDHEWISVQKNVGTIGITDYAQHELGDVVYVDLPEVGDTFEAGDPFGSVESVKAVSDLYCPASGEVVEANTALETKPELVNKDCYGAGWMIAVKVANPKELDNLMDVKAYEAYLAAEGGH